MVRMVVDNDNAPVSDALAGLHGDCSPGDDARGSIVDVDRVPTRSYRVGEGFRVHVI